ncbi:hypothetical protein [Tenacibaculum ovolyticum]|uniref:hypothetical protein n=1 Tax=Tenacibaculum ovolyticum TaxID=104270 RepID=UPI0007EC947D|nr:hypothetical protein [Tenacibaculum ovolyticum]
MSKEKNIMKKFDYNWHEKERFTEFSKNDFELLNKKLQIELLEFDYAVTHEEDIDSPIKKYTVLLPFKKIGEFKAYINQQNKLNR